MKISKSFLKTMLIQGFRACLRHALEARHSALVPWRAASRVNNFIPLKKPIVIYYILYKLKNNENIYCLIDYFIFGQGIILNKCNLSNWKWKCCFSSLKFEWCFGITLRGKNIQVLATVALLQINLGY